MSFIENLGQQLGGQAASGLLNAGMGLLMEKHNDQRQVRQQQKLTDMQVSAQRNLSQFNQDLAYDMWNKTNLAAQKKVIEGAGMNPGLLYGMGGGSGGTASVTPGSVSAGTASGAPQTTAHGDPALGLQVSMMDAQKDLIQAQAENVRADTKKKLGVDTTLGETQIKSLSADIDNKIIQGRIMKLEEEMKTAANKVAQGTIEEQVRIITQTAAKMDAEVTMAEAQNFIDQATKEAKVQQIITESVTALVQQQLLRSNIKVNAAEIRKMAADIAQGWQNLSQKGQQVEIDKFQANLKAKYPGISETLGRVFNDGIESIFKIFNKERTPHNQMP